MIMKEQVTQGSPVYPAKWLSILWIAVIALVYFLVARFSLSFVFKPVGIAAIWPPAGIFFPPSFKLAGILGLIWLPRCS